MSLEQANVIMQMNQNCQIFKMNKKIPEKGVE